MKLGAIIVIITNLIFMYGSYRQEDINRQFVHKFVEENHIEYNSAESFSNIDYVFMVRDGENGLKNMRVKDNFSKKQCTFKINQDNEIHEIMCHLDI